MLRRVHLVAYYPMPISSHTRAIHFADTALAAMKALLRLLQGTPSLSFERSKQEQQAYRAEDIPDVSERITGRLPATQVSTRKVYKVWRRVCQNEVYVF